MIHNNITIEQMTPL